MTQEGRGRSGSRSQASGATAPLQSHEQTRGGTFSWQVGAGMLKNVKVEEKREEPHQSLLTPSWLQVEYQVS